MRKSIAVVVILSLFAPAAFADTLNLGSTAAGAPNLGSPVARAGATPDMSWLGDYPQPNFHLGQLALHPYYELQELYDSNIYLVPRDQANGVVVGGGNRGSWITENDFGLETVLPYHRTTELDLGWGGQDDAYATQPNINNTFNQSAHADLVHRGGYGFTYKAGDQYVNTTDQAFSELIARQHRWMNDAYVSADYAQPNGRLAAGVDASHETDKYLDPTFAQLLNRYTDTAGFNVGYMIEPKTKAYVSYHRAEIHYTVGTVNGGQDKDNRANLFAAGLSGQITPKVTGQVEAGMTNRAYDQGAFAGAPRVVNSPTVSTSLTYEPDKASSIVLSMARFLEESTDAPNPYYTATSVSLQAKHHLPYKLSVGGQLGWELDEYPYAQQINTAVTTSPFATRRDDLYQAGVWVQYDIQKWLSTGLSFLYRERDSILTGEFNYQDEQTAWNLSAKF